MKIIISDLISRNANGTRTGHYYSVAHNYLDIFGENNCLISGGPVYSKEFKISQLLLLPYDTYSTDNFFKYRLKAFLNAWHLFKKAKGDVIVLQQCSAITIFICIFLFYHRKSELYIIQYNLEGVRNFIGKTFFYFIKNRIDGVICPNDEIGAAYNLKYCTVPDYIYTNDSRKNQDTEVAKKYDICIIGRISPEKGVVESARKLTGTKFKVIIAGRPQTEDLSVALHRICDNSENIELITDYLSDELFRYYLTSSKYALLNYQGEYSLRSSGIVFDTIFSNVPVIGNRCKALNFIEVNHLGLLYNNLDDLNLDLLLDNKLYNKFLKNITKYCESHDVYKDKLKNFLMS